MKTHSFYSLTYYLNTPTTQEIERCHGATLNRLFRRDLIRLAELLEDTHGAFLPVTHKFLVSNFDDYGFAGEARAIALSICRIIARNLAPRDRVNRATIATIARVARQYAETREDT